MHWLPENVSSYGSRIDGLILMITVIVGVWFVAAEVLLLFFALRWRRKEGRKASFIPGTSMRSMAWVMVPTVIVLGLDLAIDAAGAPVWAAVKEELPPADQTVRIIGKQYVWRFIHPGPDNKLDTGDDIESINQLHVRVGDTVAFELQAEEVVHSFFVPNLRLKQDAVPGRTIRGWFKATKEGEYQISCAQLCGLGHGAMQGLLHVDSPAAYQAWMTEHRDETPEGK